MKKLVLATTNKNKVKEIQDILGRYDIEVVTPPDGFDPIEDGDDFSENAYKKAFEAAKLMNLPALADDSGLEIDALNGAPGIYSARYAQTDSERIDRILRELKDVRVEERTAQFTCAMVVVAPDGTTLFGGKGHCKGIIINERLGDHGFGYDPVFFIPELNKTMAELTMDEKNQISHRSKALKQVIQWLIIN